MIKKGDFIKVEYTAKIKDGGRIFDTTDEKIAKESGIYSEKTLYGPVTLIAGAGYTIKGLDESFEGKSVGKKYNITLAPEKAFGNRSGKLIKLIPMRIFKKNQISPVPGLPINIDGTTGVVRSVSGGRVIVDFNHPLAGKEIEYNVRISEVVKDKAAKLKSLLTFHTSVPEKEIEVKILKESIKIKMEKPLVKQILTMLEKEIKLKLPEFGNVKIEWDVPDLMEMMKAQKKTADK